MAFCRNCGTQLAENSKYCQKCGKPVSVDTYRSSSQRQFDYEGKVYKCPNCGEILPSFVRNCPACGLELRGKKAVSSVREFALKLEAIEARREYEPPKTRPSKRNDSNSISKTDEQKINLIQTFSIPNTKEDILEFMILATSNVNIYAVGHAVDYSAAETKIAEAWISKTKQVYEKAKAAYGTEQDFVQIENLYDSLNHEIKKAQRAEIMQPVIGIMCIFGFLLGLILLCVLLAPSAGRKETARMEEIEQQAIVALENGEYKKALLLAESIDFDPSFNSRGNEVLARQWEIRRELLIDEILEAAEKDGVFLQRSEKPESSTKPEPSEEIDSNGGFFTSFRHAAQPGIEAFKESINEFIQILEQENNSSSGTNGVVSIDGTQEDK